MPFVCIFDIQPESVRHVVPVSGDNHVLVGKQYYPVRAVSVPGCNTYFQSLPIVFTDVKKLWSFERKINKLGYGYMTRVRQLC